VAFSGGGDGGDGSLAMVIAKQIKEMKVHLRAQKRH
jgi:hypothetical protein